MPSVGDVFSEMAMDRKGFTEASRTGDFPWVGVGAETMVAIRLEGGGFAGVRRGDAAAFPSAPPMDGESPEECATRVSAALFPGIPPETAFHSWIRRRDAGPLVCMVSDAQVALRLSKPGTIRLLSPWDTSDQAQSRIAKGLDF